ncbi:MAG TPA: MBL fold metallo-hydrolase [Deltaproteobacteria bacterium]|nr:MBL fold metallo-hydrolase [Deltaproteobacteria bacterium]
MSERKLIVFGTASQVPSRNRNQGGYLLRFDDHGFLFDPGEGTQRQMIFAGAKVSEITKIFITHFHGDHCLGLAGIIQRISLDRVSHSIEVYYPSSGQEFFENLCSSSLFYNIAQLKGCPVTGPGIIFEDSDMVIEARRLDHDVETYGYSVREKDSYTLIAQRLEKAGISGSDISELKSAGVLAIMGRTINIEEMGAVLPGQRFAFVMDTRLCRAVYELADHADFLVCEATYLSDLGDKAREYGHLTAAQAGMIARDACAGKLILTHFSQRYMSTDAHVDEAGRFHEDVVAANDGDHIDFPKRKRPA